MKFWVYSGGQIYGPFDKEVLAGSVPGFGAHSLVCPEGLVGDKPGDWRLAESVAELASVFKVHAGAGSGASASPRAGPPPTGAPPTWPGLGPSSEPLPSGSETGGFDYGALPAGLRETPPESDLGEHFKTYVQELELKDRHISSLEQNLSEAQQVFDRYQGEINRILDDNLKAFEHVQEQISRKDMALEQAAQKITTLEESLHLVVRPEFDIAGPVLDLKRELDTLRVELAKTQSELTRYKEGGAWSAAPTPAESKPEERADKPPEGEQKGLKLGLKGLGPGLKSLSGLGGVIAKPSLMKPTLGVKPGLTLGLKPQQPQLPAPEKAPETPPTAEAAPATQAAAAPAAPEAPTSLPAAVQTPAAAAPEAPAVPSRPVLPSVDLATSGFEMPTPSWEGASLEPIVLPLPEGVIESPARPEPAAPAQRAPVVLPTPAQPLVPAQPPSPAQPPAFTLKKKDMEQVIGEAPSSALTAKPSVPRPLSFQTPPAPPPPVAEAAQAVGDIFSAAAQPAASEAPATPPPSAPAFSLQKKALPQASAPAAAAPPVPVQPVPLQAAPASPAQLPPAAPAQPAGPVFALKKKTLPLAEGSPSAPAAAPEAPPPGGQLKAKPLSFTMPGAPPQAVSQPATPPPAPPPAQPLAFKLEKKTLGAPGAPTPKALKFAPSSAPIQMPPARPAPAPEPPKKEVSALEAAYGAILEAPPASGAAPPAPAAAPAPAPLKPAAPVELKPEPLPASGAAPSAAAPEPPKKEVSALEAAYGAIVEAPPASGAAPPAPAAAAAIVAATPFAAPPTVPAALPETKPPEPAMVAPAFTLTPPAETAPLAQKPPLTTFVTGAPPQKEAPAKEKKEAPAAVRPAVPEKKEDEAPKAPEKKKRTSKVAVFAVITLLVVGGVAAALMLFWKEFGEMSAPVVTMPSLDMPPVSLPAPAPQQSPTAPAFPSGAQQGAAPAPGGAGAAAPWTSAPAQTAAPQTDSLVPTASQMPGRIAESIQEAIRFVKEHKLGGGRGTVHHWFGVQFLTSPGDGKKEEWSAVHTSGQIYIVQYHLTHPNRQGQIPDIYYTFRVDLATKTVTGHDRPAIELLTGRPASASGGSAQPAGTAGTAPAPARQP